MPAQTAIACIQDEPIEFLAIAIEPNRLQDIASRLGAHDMHPVPGVEAQDAALSTVAGEIRRYLISEPVITASYLDALSDAFFVRLLTLHATDNHERLSQETLSPFMMRKLADHVDDRLDGPIKISELAGLAGLSRSHFSRAFHRSFGQSARDFVLHRRVSEARRMLVETAHSMTEISMRCGFSTPSHFSTAFRREMGIQPAAYRLVLTGMSNH